MDGVTPSNLVHSNDSNDSNNKNTMKRKKLEREREREGEGTIREAVKDWTSLVIPRDYKEITANALRLRRALQNKYNKIV